MESDVDDPLEVDPAEAAIAEEIGVAKAAFGALVPLAPGDAALAALAVEAVVRAIGDARGPDDPTPGMMNVPTLLDDPLARATLAECSPSSRDVLGDLERVLVGMGASERVATVERIRTAVAAADRRIARGAVPGIGPSGGRN